MAVELELRLDHVPYKHGAYALPYTRHEPRISTRGGKVVSYPHPRTTQGMAAWKSAWFFAGSLVVPPPIVLEVYVRCLRPDYHLLKSGRLSAAGEQHPYPGGFDCSNVVKLVEDALKTLAFGDDAEIIALHSSKRWVSDAAMAGTFVTIRTAEVV